MLRKSCRSKASFIILYRVICYSQMNRGGENMIIQSKLSNEELLNYIYAATREYKKLLGRSFLLIGKNKKTDYYWFECSFRKKYFMHLLGIKSKTYTAEEFFDICFEFVFVEGSLFFSSFFT